jgi:hypothetical protein
MEHSILKCRTCVRQAYGRGGDRRSNTSHQWSKEYVKSTSRDLLKVMNTLVGNGGAETSDGFRSQLYMNPTSTEQQDDSEKQYDFVMYDPQEACNDAAEKDIITSGTDGVVAGPPPYPNKSSGIPGRRGHLVPGSSRPWRVNKQS